MSTGTSEGDKCGGHGLLEVPWDTGKHVQWASGYGSNVGTRVKDPGFRSRGLADGCNQGHKLVWDHPGRARSMKRGERPRANPRGVLTFKDFMGEYSKEE